MQGNILIVGASARAAAFSTLRAGLQPWCADLFADRDLQARCPCLRIPSTEYPAAFQQCLERGPAGPWMYTGGLENRPSLVRQMARRRPLWGNDEKALRRARVPEAVAAILEAAQVPHLAVHRQWSRTLEKGKWLMKPLHSAGGHGIQTWTASQPLLLQRGEVYFQEQVEGEPCAAIYLGDGRKAQLLGVTRQLVGENWLHAPPFHYCGSIGPLVLEPSLRRGFEQLGAALAAGAELRGLFGVDCVLRNGVPWPVEVNPRYAASVEVLEYDTGVAALDLHRQVFETARAIPAPVPQTASPRLIGKAILFAREALTFPVEGPWLRQLQTSHSVDELPDFADIPQPGELIPMSRPILTFFARAETVAACVDSLRQTAATLDHRLFGR
jgi:predicted ATP-grasp superfamily ATP-dependent carboligase